MENPTELKTPRWQGCPGVVACAAGITALFALSVCGFLSGCGSTATKQQQPFFTSGSQEANQRAAQFMTKQEQLADTGQDAGEKKVKPAKPAEPEDGTATGPTNQPAQAEGKLTLYDRLGAEAGISNIVADFVSRVTHDPRVNWERKGVKGTGLFGTVHNKNTILWQATPQSVAVLETHMVQFLALAGGGPTQYSGREIQSVHAGMDISNPEFDAAIGDLKASLDKLKIPDREQKELLAIIETTRPLIVTVR
jgi:hemoglobin